MAPLDRILINFNHSSWAILPYAFNNIKAKTEYAIAHGAGIMIWEISQDASDSLSLLKVIGEKL